MIDRGDWLAPFYNEAPFFDKPALFHILQSTAMRILGPTELAARLVPAVAAVALVGLTVWCGAALVSLEVGLIAGVLLAMNPGVFGLSRYAILDTLFTAFMFGGSALLTVAALKDRRGLQWPGYVLLAIAVLVKGPLALALCGLTLVVASWWSADARARLWSLNWVAGLALIVVLASPWFVYMFARFGDAFLQGYVLDENLRLYGSSRFANQPGPTFYLRIIIVGMLPWTGLAIGRLVDDVRAARRGDRPDTVEILLWAWTFAILVFFSFSTFKLDHYIFPVAPALCLVCARAWTDVRRQPDAPRHAGARIGLQMIGPLLLVMGVGAAVFLLVRLELPRAAVVIPAVVTVAGGLLIARAELRRSFPPAMLSIVALAVAVAYAGVLQFPVRALDERKVIPAVARWVSANAGEARIATYGLNRWEPAFRFYVGEHTTFLRDAAEAAAYFDAPEPFFCTMTREGFDELSSRGLALKVVHERDGLWATSGRVLWRRRLPPAQFLVVTRAG